MPQTREQPERYEVGQEQEIRDHQNPRKYFAMVPNIVDDSDLGPYERTLYLHYVRVGTCNESTRTTAEKCHMSEGKVSEARRALEEKGWIAIGTSRYGTCEIYILDRWSENMAKYSPDERRSPGERNVHHTNATFTTRTQRSPGEPKKNHSKTTEPVVEAATAQIESDTEEETPAERSHLIWREVEQVFVTVSPAQFQKFCEVWRQFPDPRRHQFALSQALRANPRRFEFYLRDFVSFDPNRDRTWGLDRTAALEALPAARDGPAPAPAHPTFLMGEAEEGETLAETLARLLDAGRIQKEMYDATRQKYSAQLGEPTAGLTRANGHAGGTG